MAAHRLARTIRISRRLAVLIVCTTTAIITACGIALAYWSTSGGGAGSATGATMTINVTALQGGDTNQKSLLPGQSGDVIVRVNNPNAFSVHVTSIVQNGDVTASNGCSQTGVTFTAPSDYSSGQFTLSPGSHLIRIGGGAIMSLASDSACQGATFTMPLSVTVQK